MRVFIGILFIAMSMSLQVHANGCTDRLQEVGVFANSGEVWVIMKQFGRGWMICNLNEPRETEGVTTTPESCKAIYASLLSANLSKTEVHFELMDGFTCEGTSSWTSLPHYNISVRNP